MNRIEPHDDLEALTPDERDALAAFDDVVETTCSPIDELDQSTPKKENAMRTWNITSLLSAAGILAAVVSLGAVLWNQWSDGPGEAVPTGALHALEQEAKTPRLVLLVGLGDIAAQGSTRPMVLLSAEGAATAETYAQFTFDQKKADLARAAAIKAGVGKPGGYRNGNSYQLKDDKGRKLPVFWKPWAPGEAARRANRGDHLEPAATTESATKALVAARAGKPYNADLVQGGWVYASPEWYGPKKKGFTEKDIVSPKRGKSYLGARAVNFSIRRDRQGDFHDFTAEIVGQALCVVVDDMIWTNPVVREALDNNVMISGGGGGFTEEEQDYLMRAFGEK